MGLRNFTSDVLPLAWGYAALRSVAPRGGWRFRAFGYCASCDRESMFVLAKRHAAWVARLAAQWDCSDEHKRALVARESSICALCRANLRMRAQARAVLDVLQLRRTSELVACLSGNPQFLIFEAATNTVFRSTTVLCVPNYIASEYRENAPSGAIVDGILNEDLQALSFADASIDIVLTSDVLEHVADLECALDEISRVLKPGGFHVLTVPSDPALPHTIERARIVGGKIVHDFPEVYHGDSIRGDGILAFRDFGADTAERLSRASMSCRAINLVMPDDPAAIVYVAQKAS
jgi:SAM-dependent methyltransferase